MKENELPIRHQRNPKLPPIPHVKHGYRRERAPSDLSWIPASKAEVADVFPFKKLSPTEQSKPGSDKPKLGEAFLRATTPRLPQSIDRGADIEITPQMRVYLDEVEWALNRLEGQLVKNGGLFNGDNFLTVTIGDKSLQEYLEVMKTDLIDESQYDYVMSLMHKMIDRIEKIHEALQNGYDLSTVPSPPYEPNLVKFTRRKRDY